MKTRKIAVMLLCLAISANFYGCGQKTTTAKATEKVKLDWKVVKTVKTEGKCNIGGFYDSNLGITVGYAGEVHYTNDGGKTWPLANNNSYCRFGLCIVNDRIAWSCGNGIDAGHVRKTVDGGKNWQAVTDFGDVEPNQCRYINFFDGNTGWIASPKKLGSTKDGGKTWSVAKLPDGIGDITEMYWAKENVGYLIDTKNNLYTTEDSGKTWNSKALNINNINNVVCDTNASCLRFYDSNNAILFYYDKNLKLKCFKTTDAGTTWKEQSIPDIQGDGLYMSGDGKSLSINSNADTHVITVLQQQ